MGPIRRHTTNPQPLRGVIDVYKCPGCGDTLAVNADSLTFSKPPPLECKDCPGEPDMWKGRYYAVDTSEARRD